MIDISTADGKKQAILLGVGGLVLIVAIILIARSLMPAGEQNLEPPAEASGAPQGPARGLAPGVKFEGK